MSQEFIVQNIQKKFNALFQQTPQFFAAPGRINIIGEHTDYNEGFVLPAAIDKKIVFGMQKNDLKKFRFYSLDYDEYQEFDSLTQNANAPLWTAYLLGVLAQFNEKGLDVSGIDCVFGGDIPLGAGLSSSAALECGFAVGVNDLMNHKVGNYDLVKMAQKAEHEYAGVMCGIMDQYASVFGRRNQVFLLDCRTNTHQYFPFDTTEYSLLLIDTKVKHSLASSAYNERRKECAEGVAYFHSLDADISSLRDVSLEMIQQHSKKLNKKVYQRCKFVVEENARVIKATQALKQNDFKKLGQLIYQSHEGLQKEYEVSCPELDFLVDQSKKVAAVLGARMMGGGFGGCTINLIHKDAIDDYQNQIANNYQKEFHIRPDFYQVNIDNGASAIKFE